MNDSARFQYTLTKNLRGETTLRPLLPIRLSIGERTIETIGLLDTGADVNVLPYGVGIALGGDWERARTGLQLSGNLADYEARGVLVTASVGQIEAVKLAFAWTQAENLPLLRGQVNFFAEFDVCFMRARGEFEVRLKTLL